jgi:hypothetical protein
MYEKARQYGDRAYEDAGTQGNEENLGKFHTLYEDWFRIEHNRQKRAENIQNAECPFRPRTNKSNDKFHSTAVPFLARLEKDLQDRFVKKEKSLHERVRHEVKDKGTGQFFFHPKLSSKSSNVCSIPLHA